MSFPLEQRTASWSDVMSKAKRLILEGDVALHRNGYNNIAATVNGDHGTYQVEIGRDDPNTRVITTWQCTCPWNQFAWDRIKYKYLEGRTCSHTLATFWKSLATPLDEDASEEQRTAPGTKQGPAGWGLSPAPQPDVGVQTFNPDQPTIADEMQDPNTVPQQHGIDQELLQLQQQEPEQFEFQSPYEQQLVQQFPNLFAKNTNNDSARIMDIRHVAAVNDFERIKEALYPTAPGTRKTTPTVQIINQNGVTGEMRGGKIPMPDAVPVGTWGNNYDLYKQQDLGFNPQTNVRHNPAQNAPEERGRHGIIPFGARATAVDVDPSGQVCLFYSMDSYPLHHGVIKTWVDGSDVKIVNSRIPPYRQRRR
jgi:hypothetical protein